MLISYPFLSASTLHDDEDRYLAQVLSTHGLPNEGGFPVSLLPTARGDLPCWHGGIHLRGGGEPVRAIADGTVVAFRFAAQAETYGTLGPYDTGFVLLRHETQAGEQLPVVFYSLYMHLAAQDGLAADRLAQLPRWLREQPGPEVRRPGQQKVWRKDVLGFAGQLYRHEAMHFEVFMLDADFRRVWCNSRDLTARNGRVDGFGDAHFVLPAGQAFVARHPRAPAKGAHRIDFPLGGPFPLPVGEAGSNPTELFVSVGLHGGRRTAQTYRAVPGGGHEPVGAPVVQDGFEYELWGLASALYPDCPSAGLEWLRLGRVVGSDRSTREENWQLVRYSETAVGYVNLAPAAITKLSDADFPHWQGWSARDEGQASNAADGLCDDAPTLALVKAASTNPLAAQALQHLVCKAPSEWDDADLEARYARLRAPGQALAAPDAWERFRDHVAKMAFWSAAGLPERSVWHFHPLRFIRHFRKSGWLTRSEFFQLRPSHTLRQDKKGMLWEKVSPWTAGNKVLLPDRYLLPLNQMMRKYGIVSGKRQAAFFGNSIQETIWMRTLEESGGPTLWYAPWFGRGFLQLTNPSNYVAYWRWRGRPVSDSLALALKAAYDRICALPPLKRGNADLQDSNFPGLNAQHLKWREDVQGSLDAEVSNEQLLAPTDSAGFYWTQLKMPLYADAEHVMERVVFPTTAGEKVLYRSPAFWKASAAVNLPASIHNLYSRALNGFEGRCSAYGVAMAVLTEVPLPTTDGGRAQVFPDMYERALK